MKIANIELGRPMEMLMSARDQVRLDWHLLSMDTRQKWSEFEAKILTLEEKVVSEAESLTDATAELAIDLSGSVKDFVDTHVRHVRH